MKPILHHPDGVIVDGKVYRRDELFVADRITVREWLALGVLIGGIVLWILGTIGGALWLIGEVIRRWH